MRTFEVRTPDGRYIRYLDDDLEKARGALNKGYELVGEVLGADGEGRGGFVDPVGVGAKSVMAILLERHGSELIEWLRQNTVVVRSN